MEGQYALKHGTLKSFAEQQLVDCCTGNYGCNGGWMDTAFRYINTTQAGIELEESYPYVAHVSISPSIHPSVHPSVHSFTHHPSTHPSTHLSTHSPTIHHPIRLSIRPPIHPPSITPSVCPSVHLFTHPPAHLFIHPFISSVNLSYLRTKHAITKLVRVLVRITDV